LYITTKNLTDLLQIIEQILPHFTPSIDVKVKDSPDLNIETNCKITLMSSDLQMVLEGDIETSDELEVTLNFEVEGYLYKSSTEAKVIHTVDVSTFKESDLGIDSLLTVIHEE
jgi:hypothetical protein